MIRILAARLREDLYRPVFRRVWPVWVGAVALALANLFMFIYARAIGVFPQMAMWGSSLYNLAGIKVDSPFLAYPLAPVLRDTHSMICFGILFGAAISALCAEEFKLRHEDWRGYLAALSGGALMGLGTVLMPPCNVGGFYSATMSLSLSGPLTVFGLLPGAYVGGLLLKRQTRSALAAFDYAALVPGTPAPVRGASRQPLAGLLLALALAAAAACYAWSGMNRCAGLLLFGALFGTIFQRSRLCFAAAFREIFISRSGASMKWILLSVAIGTVGMSLLKSRGYQPMSFIMPVGLHTVVGGFVFGVGMVVAGGCGAGILWRAAEGYTRAWVAMLAGMLTAGSWVLIYRHHVGEGWLYGAPVSLGQKFGWFWGTVLVLGFLAAFYLFILWIEARGHAHVQSHQGR
jgi:uncharacterized membrane protein YedE/YeeE